MEKAPQVIAREEAREAALVVAEGIRTEEFWENRAQIVLEDADKVRDSLWKDGNYQGKWMSQLDTAKMQEIASRLAGRDKQGRQAIDTTQLEIKDLQRYMMQVIYHLGKLQGRLDAKNPIDNPVDNVDKSTDIVNSHT